MSAWGKKPPAPSATGSDTVSPALSDAAIVAQSPVGAVGGPASHTSWITGSTIRITTLSGEVIEGEVYAVDDASTESIIIRLPNTSRATLPSVFDYRIIATRFIREAKYVTHQKGPPMAEPSYVAVAELRRRKAKAVHDAQEAIDQIGVGVSAEGQAVFDALAKTMKCRWVGDSINVLDVVTLKPPYGDQDFTLDASASDQALAQVQRVLKDHSARSSGAA